MNAAVLAFLTSLFFGAEPRVEVDLLAIMTTLTPTATGIDATIGVGAVHGVIPGGRGDVFPPLKPKDGLAEIVARAEVIALSERSATVRLIESPASRHELVGVGSVVEIRAMVPKRVAEGAVYRCAANAITFTDNQRADFTTLEALVTAPDDREEKRVLDAMVLAGRDVVDQAGGIAGQAKWGRLKGKSVADALAAATPDDYADFLRFVAAYPGKYIGKSWKISETFATWIVNGAPPSVPDLLLQLRGLSKRDLGPALAAVRAADRLLVVTEALRVADRPGTSVAEAKALADFADAVAKRSPEASPRVAAEAAVVRAVALGRAIPTTSPAREKALLAASKAYRSAADQLHAAGAHIDGLIALNNAAVKSLDADVLDGAQTLAVEVRARVARYQGSATTPQQAQNFLLRDAYAAGIIAEVAKRQGRHRDVIALLVPVLPRYAQAGYRGTRELELGFLDRVARARKALGEQDEALALYARSEAIAIELGDLARQVDAVHEAGAVHYSRSRWNEALADYRRASGLARGGQLDAKEARAHAAEGQTLWSLGQWQQSLDAHDAARALWERAGDTTSLAWQALQTARIRRDMGEREAASADLERVLVERRKAAVPSGIAEVLVELGALHLVRSMPAEARVAYDEARAIYAALGQTPDVAACVEGLARAALLERDYAGAEGRARQAIALRAAEGARLEAASLQLLLAWILSEAGRPESAESVYREVITHIGDVPETIGFAKLGLAGLLAKRGDTDAARELIDAVEREAVARSDMGLAGRAAEELAGLHGAQGEFHEALAAFVKAETRAKASGQKPRQVSVLTSKAWTLIDLGDIAEARKTLDSAEALARDLHDPVQDGWIENTRANLASVLGDTTRVIEHYERGMVKMRAARFAYGEAALTFNKALVLHGLRDFDGALAGFQAAETLAGTSVTSDLVAALPLARSRTLYEMGSLKEATSSAERGLALARKLVKRRIPDGLQTLATIATKRGRHDEALKLLDEAIALELAAAPKAFSATGNKGIALVKAGRYREAVAILRSVMAKAEATGVTAGWEAPYYLAVGLMRAGEDGADAEALKALEAAIVVIERPSGLIGDDKAKARYFADKVEAYRLIVKLLLARGRADEALRYVERAQAVELRSSAPAVSDGDAPEAGAETVPSAMAGELEVQEAQLQALVDTEFADGRGDSEKARRLDELLASVKRRRGAFLESVDRDDARFDRYAVRPLQLEKLQEHLEEGTLLISTVELDSSLIVFAVTQKVLTHFAMPLTPASTGKGTVETLVSQLRRELDVERADQGGAAGLKRARTAAKRLYDLVLEKPFAALGEPKTLLVSASGPLRYVPFAALWNGQRYVVERTTVVNVTTLDREKFGRRGSDDGAVKTVLAIADPGGNLPGAHDEALAVRDAVGDGLVLEGSDATLQAVRAQVRHPGYDVLHFATHGHLDGVVPARSSIQLAGGALTYNDIPTLSLTRTRLVVLSACSTAVRAGENGGGVGGLGIAGIAYQFQRTQVGSVLATLWDVDDTATAALMQAFYERTREGQSFAEALAGAQRALLREPVDVLGTRHDHPAFWAPFVLMGTP
ncbi:MAG: CHAT domain-containing protein [Myxococcales bacterium]|nr:CHAT domain-containing protein [Myxococcales bacterium]